MQGARLEDSRRTSGGVSSCVTLIGVPVVSSFSVYSTIGDDGGDDPDVK